jgi:hypothetical protein
LHIFIIGIYTIVDTIFVICIIIVNMIVIISLHCISGNGFDVMCDSCLPGGRFDSVTGEGPYTPGL